LVSGQVNFYKAFLGVVNATDGDFLEGYLIENPN
jgi:hypothetical protein